MTATAAVAVRQVANAKGFAGGVVLRQHVRHSDAGNRAGRVDGDSAAPVAVEFACRHTEADMVPVGRPVPVAYTQGGAPAPQYVTPVGAGSAPACYDQPNLPNYAWPSYAAYPNYAALTYPKKYSPAAWPYIGPFYPYPQVPLGWRKVTLEWHDGW